MKPTFVSHEDYQNFVLEQLRKHYSGGVLTIVNNDWPIIYKLRITDLSYLTSWLLSSYSNRGPKPQDPASLMRSYLLLHLAKPTLSITEWVDELHRVPFYAIISGFEPGKVPGIGTFYDFFHRLWGRENPNVKHKIKPKRQKKKKKKPKKGEKAAPSSPGIVRKLINQTFKKSSFHKALI